jgi:hypothetical protein
MLLSGTLFERSRRPQVLLTRIGFDAHDCFFFSLSLTLEFCVNLFQKSYQHLQFISHSYKDFFLLTTIFFILNKQWNYKYFLILSPLIFNLSDLIPIFLFLISYKITIVFQFHPPFIFFLSFKFSSSSFDCYLFCLRSFFLGFCFFYNFILYGYFSFKFDPYFFLSLSFFFFSNFFK